MNYAVKFIEINGQYFIEHIVGTDVTRTHFLVPLDQAEKAAESVADMVRKAADEARRAQSGLVVPSSTIGGNGAIPRR